MPPHSLSHSHTVMAISKLKLLFPVILYLLAISATTTATSPATFPPSIPPSAGDLDHLRTYPATVFASILASLGFQELSSAAVDANLSTHTPVTIFAPSDSSLLTCPSCSISLLLQEHAVPGLYSLQYLRNLAFGTKLETLASDYCLTITTTNDPAADSKRVFVNGVEISHPDLFYNGAVMVHGIQGFVSHLSPLSCNIERMMSLAFPPPGPFKAQATAVMRLMLKDAIIRLRFSGYTVVSLALKVKFAEMSEHRSLTIFALDDGSIFSGASHAYLYHFRFHVVPDRRLNAADLVSLNPLTVLPTMESGQKLVVTTAGGGGPLAPMKINYVKVSTLDLLHNKRIAVHGISTAFPHMHHHLHGKGVNTEELEHDHHLIEQEIMENALHSSTEPADVANPPQAYASPAPAPACGMAVGSNGLCEVPPEAPAAPAQGINSMVDLFKMEEPDTF